MVVQAPFQIRLARRLLYFGSPTKELTMANNKQWSETKDKGTDQQKKQQQQTDSADLRKGNTASEKQAIPTEAWPVHAQPGAKDDVRIAGKPGFTSNP